MAAFNSTETLAASGFSPFVAGGSELPELEKISCSFRGKAVVHPLHLMGKTIRFAEVLESEIGLGEGFANESSLAIGTVLAVCLGSIQHGIETTLLLQQADGSAPYYLDISRLTVLEVLQ